MNRYQQDIIWLGLILIALNIIINIGEIKAVIFGSPGGNPASPPAGPTPKPSTPTPANNPVIAPGQMPVQPSNTPPGSMVV